MRSKALSGSATLQAVVDLSARVAPQQPATIAGADDFVETTLWGTEHLAFLKRFYGYANGIPSDHTQCDVLAALDPALFKACFLVWIDGLRDEDPDIIAIDGKTSRRSRDGRKGRHPLHLVSAWAARQHIVLGQQASEEKSNEITATPLLLGIST
jgi:hypothetical protein